MAGVAAMSSNRRPIEPAIRGTTVSKYRKPIEERTATKLNKKKSKSIKELDKNQVKAEKNTPSPKSWIDSDVRNKKVNEKLQFHLNRTYGTKIDNTSIYFDRLYSVIPERELVSTCQYVFFVRPSLNIYADNDKGGHKLFKLSSKQINAGYHAQSYPAEDQFIRYMQDMHPNTLRSLTSQLPGEHDFIPFLVGRTESLQVPDYSIQDYSMTQPYSGHTTPYASHAQKSMTGGTFEATFREDKSYRVHKLFQTWLYYIDAVTTNKFEPKFKYIRHNKMDYATSVYLITCGPDAETILYWQKYVGAFPTVTPNSGLSFNLRGQVDNKVSVTFDYFRHEPLDPYILVDFNKNAHVTNANSKPYVPVYSSTTLNDIGFRDQVSKKRRDWNRTMGSTDLFKKTTPVVLGTGNGLVGCPYICRVGDTYHLRWKKIKDISGKK